MTAMLPQLVLGIGLLVGLILLTRWFIDADPKDLARYMRYGGIVVVVLFVVYLAVTGRLVMAGALFFLLPMMLRWRAVRNRLRAASGPTPGQASELSTAYLSVRLDHDTGAMSGVVRRGRFEGLELSAMPLDDLRALLAECRAQDVQSVAILEALLDRTYGADWRDGEPAAGAGTGDGAAGGPMARDKAYKVLGLAPGATAKEIKRAHHRLMMKFHPDKGGSDYIAAKLNEAKDLLLDA